MSKKETTELAAVNPELLAELKDLYPAADSGYSRIMLPRIGYKAQDVMEGEGKAKRVTIEAGTFLEERETAEVDEEGKKVWTKTELGPEMEGIILFRRYQLSYYDEANEEYANTPIFDDKEEVLPLFQAKKEIAKGTMKELKALYMFKDSEGKEKSKLQENRILYIVKDGELFQLNLHGSSMYAFMKYETTVVAPTVLTHFASEPREKGATKWNQMTFSVKRPLDNAELQDVLGKTKEIRAAIAMEKGARAAETIKYVQEDAAAEKSFKEIDGKSIDF